MNAADDRRPAGASFYLRFLAKSVTDPLTYSAKAETIREKNVF
jgi:hypothetical protein